MEQTIHIGAKDYYSIFIFVHAKNHKFHKNQMQAVSTGTDTGSHVHKSWLRMKKKN